MMALIINSADILLRPSKRDHFVEWNTLPQTHMKRILAVGAGAYVQETDHVLLRQTHQAVPVQGIAQRMREGPLHNAVARRVRDHLQRPRIRNESNFAKL